MISRGLTCLLIRCLVSLSETERWSELGLKWWPKVRPEEFEFRNLGRLVIYKTHKPDTGNMKGKTSNDNLGIEHARMSKIRRTF